MALEQTPNVRVYCDGMDKEFKQGWISTIVALVTLLLYTGWMHILMALMVASFFHWIPRTILILLLSTLALPAKPVLWTAFCQSYMFRSWREYFKFSYLLEAELDHSKKYIFVEFPHGVFPLGPLLAGSLMQVVLPHFSIYALAADSVFRVPFWRHFIAWLGCLPANQKNFNKLLSKGSVAVVVGGIAEMYMQDPHKERVKLRDRKGYVRTALQHGVPIVPVYHFGNTQLMDFGPQYLERWSRKYRSALGLMHGRWGLPLPRRYPLFMVMGKPVEVPKMDMKDPEYEKTVDEVAQKVVDSLQAVYDRHRKEFGWENRDLSIE